MRIKVEDTGGSKLTNHKLTIQIIKDGRTKYVQAITNGDGIFVLLDDYRGAKMTTPGAKTCPTPWVHAHDGATLTIDINSLPKQA